MDQGTTATSSRMHQGLMIPMLPPPQPPPPASSSSSLQPQPQIPCNFFLMAQNPTQSVGRTCRAPSPPGPIGPPQLSEWAIQRKPSKKNKCPFVGIIGLRNIYNQTSNQTSLQIQYLQYLTLSSKHWAKTLVEVR